MHFRLRSENFLSTELVGKINALFRCLKRFGYINDNITVAELLIDRDLGLFHNIQFPYIVCITYSFHLEHVITPESTNTSNYSRLQH